MDAQPASGCSQDALPSGVQCIIRACPSQAHFWTAEKQGKSPVTPLIAAVSVSAHKPHAQLNWCPSIELRKASLLQGPLTAVAVDATGQHLVTAGIDSQVKVTPWLGCATAQASEQPVDLPVRSQECLLPGLAAGVVWLAKVAVMLC